MSSPALPLTVTSVDHVGGETYGVTVAFADGSTGSYLIPASMATIEAVSISAVALAQLTDPNRPYANVHHRGHRRYDPRST